MSPSTRGYWWIRSSRVKGMLHILVPEVRGYDELHEDFLGEARPQPGKVQFQTHGQVL